MEDVLLMASGDAFVGKFTSNLDRNAFALMAGRLNGCMPPYVSLDSTWCYGGKWTNLAGKEFTC